MRNAGLSTSTRGVREDSIDRFLATFASALPHLAVLIALLTACGPIRDVSDDALTADAADNPGDVGVSDAQDTLPPDQTGTVSPDETGDAGDAKDVVDVSLDVSASLCPAKAPIACTKMCDDGNACTLDRCVGGACASASGAIQEAWAKGTGTPSEHYGQAVALHAGTLVVGAPGVNRAYVLVSGDAGWVQQGVLEATDQTLSGFGTAVAVFGDIAAVGTTAETVCIFSRANAIWSQQTCIKAATGDAGDHFGSTIALSGSTLVVGAHGESSKATGVGGDGSDNSVSASGAAYVFIPSAGSWTQVAYLKPAAAQANLHFGYAVAVHGDVIAVGAPGEAGDAKQQAGAAFVFNRSGTTWSAGPKLKASNPDAHDLFGQAVAVNGATLVVGAPGEASAAIGSGGNAADNSAPGRGAGYVFAFASGTWNQTAYLKSPTAGGFAFGSSVAVFGGDLAIGAPKDSDTNANTPDSGAVFVWRKGGSVWTSFGTLSAKEPASGARLGTATAIEGASVVAGAPGESTCGTGVAPVSDGSKSTDSGAAYAFVVDAGCDDGDPCTADACLPSAGCTHLAVGGCAAACGDGFCAGEETVMSCPADCGFLTNRYAGPCADPGSWNGCGHGYVCVARNAAAGGNVCVADFETWSPIGDAHPASEFNEFADYDVDNKTGLHWAKPIVLVPTWNVGLTACVTQTLGGFSDWRMPTMAELESIVDYSVDSPTSSMPDAIWPTWPYLWTNIPYPFVVSASALFLNFEIAAGGPTPTADAAAAVRCVRSAPVQSIPGAGGRFGLSDDGKQVLDRISGLHWQRLVGGGGKFAAAKGYCEGNVPGLAGTGWRLPSVGELRQLADRETDGAFKGIFLNDWAWGGWTTTARFASNYYVYAVNCAPNWAPADAWLQADAFDDVFPAQCVR